MHKILLQSGKPQRQLPIFILISFTLFGLFGSAINNVYGIQADTPTPSESPTATNTLTPTLEPAILTLRIFRDEDSLTIFVPASDFQIDIHNFVLRVTNQSGQQIERAIATDFQAFWGMPYNTLNTLAPICFHLKRDRSTRAVPLDCQGITLLTQNLADADVFWYNTSVEQGRLIILLQNSIPIGVCPSGISTCEVNIEVFPLPTSTPFTPTSTATVSPLSIESETEIPVPVVTQEVLSEPASTQEVNFASPDSLCTISSSQGTVNIRSGPGTNFNVVAQLQPSQSLEATGVYRDWLLLNLPNGKSGWIVVSAIILTGNCETIPFVDENGRIQDISSPASTPELNVSDSCRISPRQGTVNIRSGPGTNFNVVAQLQPSQSLEATGLHSGWYRVTLSDQGEGWIVETVVITSGDCSTLPPV